MSLSSGREPVRAPRHPLAVAVGLFVLALVGIAVLVYLNWE